jgi:hypothetical protein
VAFGVGRHEAPRPYTRSTITERQHSSAKGFDVDEAFLTIGDTIVAYEPLWSALTSFYLAERVVQYQMYAENDWCGSSETLDESPADLVVLQKDEMKRLLAKLQDQVRTDELRHRISLVSGQLEATWQDFVRAFHGDERHNRIERLDRWEPDDPNFCPREYLLRGWPFKMKPWNQFIAGLNGLLKMLGDADHPCYQLSHTISFGLYLHASNPHSRSYPLPPGSYLATRYAPKLRNSADRLIVQIGPLKALDFDVSQDAYSRCKHRPKCYSDWLYKKIEMLNVHLPKAIEDAAVEHDRRWGIGLPFWDDEARELRYRGHVIKHFRNDAPNQIQVLHEFQRAQWPYSIGTPTSREVKTPTTAGISQRRRLNTIKDLDRGISPKLLRFFSDGTGDGIRWEPADAKLERGIP